MTGGVAGVVPMFCATEYFERRIIIESDKQDKIQTKAVPDQNLKDNEKEKLGEHQKYEYWGKGWN